MQPIPTDEIPTDDEIRASPAFPRRLVRAFRFGNRTFWTALPLFAVAGIGRLAAGGGWAAFGTAGLIAVGTTCGQLYAIRAERQPLAEISSSSAVQSRAKKLAYDAAKPRLLRWLP